MDKSLLEVESLLQEFIPLVSFYGADGKSVSRTRELLKHVGNPHEKLKIIHVAGTSGKTSTAYFIAALIAGSSKKVGLTASPHVYSVAERIQINGVNISSKVFLDELKEFLKKINDLSVKPSYFELLLAFAIWEFARQGLEYAVVETGMGGLLDASNVLQAKDKICVITDIGYDHMHVLGNTLTEISIQKAGIIHENNVVFMYKQSKEVMSSVIDRVNLKNAKLILVNKESKRIATLSQLPSYQKRNYMLASRLYEYLSKRDGIKSSTLDPLQVKIPGRMEIINLQNGQYIVLDGAHNEQKMKAMVYSFKELFPDKKATVVIAFKKGKEYKESIHILKSITGNMIITTFDSSINLPSKSQDPNQIDKYCKSFDLKSTTIKNNKKAVSSAINSKEDIILITGSFYLVSQTRSLF